MTSPRIESRKIQPKKKFLWTDQPPIIPLYDTATSIRKLPKN